MSKKTVLIGVSSSIAAYKILDLIKILREKEIEVYVLMTKHAEKMIPSSLFAKASNHKVYTDLFSQKFDYRKILKKQKIEHIMLAQKASLFVVAPATANLLGKIACGIADDFLTTTLLATKAPVLIFPAMNSSMWQNPLVQENVKKLKKFNYFVYSPEKGKLACGSQGEGRMPEVKNIASEIFIFLEKNKKLKGKKILVTGGGTFQPIDAVRGIANKASGKMGRAIAEVCYKEGGEVLFLRAKSAVSSYLNIQEEIFETIDELENLLRKYVLDYDILFHTAAVADFIPQKKLENKLESRKSLVLNLKSAPKIINKIKKWNPKIKLVGFKAVYNLKEKDLIKKGKEKIKESQADYLVVNDIAKPGIGFGADENEVYLLSSEGWWVRIPKAPKEEIALKILDYLKF